MLCCAGGLSLPGPLRVCVCVEWIVHSVFGLLCIWRQVEALISCAQWAAKSSAARDETWPRASDST